MGTFGCTDNVPHLRLSLAVVTLQGKLIIRMHLNRKVIVGINELNQQRELSRKNIRNFLAGIRTFDNHRLIARNTGEHPALGAPDKGLHYRLELVHSR